MSTNTLQKASPKTPKDRTNTLRFLGVALAVALAAGWIWALTASEASADNPDRSYFGFEGKRSRKIDFEDDYIESMAKRPLDSLTALSDADRRRKNIHLYRKRSGFGAETAETIQQVRYN